MVKSKDRDVYRDMKNPMLLEEVHYGVHVDWKELAIALAERLEKASRPQECPLCEK